MTKEEKIAEHDGWQAALGQAIQGLLSNRDDRTGLVCARVFYMVRHADGKESIGQLGITPQDEMQTADRMLSLVVRLLADPEENWSARAVDSARKS